MKTLTFIFGTLALFGLLACSSHKQEDSTETTTPTEQTTTTTTTTTHSDGSSTTIKVGEDGVSYESKDGDNGSEMHISKDSTSITIKKPH